MNLGVWRSKDELTFDTDNMYNYSLGLAMEAPAINITSQINFGQNILQKESGTNSKKFFANLSTYYRPSSMKKLQSTFFVRAGFNDFSYTTTSQNFRETAITMGINSEF